jgi:hypothetical protein
MNNKSKRLKTVKIKVPMPMKIILWLEKMAQATGKTKNQIAEDAFRQFCASHSPAFGELKPS